MQVFILKNQKWLWFATGWKMSEYSKIVSVLLKQKSWRLKFLHCFSSKLIKVLILHNTAVIISSLSCCHSIWTDLMSCINWPSLYSWIHLLSLFTTLTCWNPATLIQCNPQNILYMSTLSKVDWWQLYFLVLYTSSVLLSEDMTKPPLFWWSLHTGTVTIIITKTIVLYWKHTTHLWLNLMTELCSPRFHMTRQQMCNNVYFSVICS